MKTLLSNPEIGTITLHPTGPDFTIPLATLLATSAERPDETGAFYTYSAAYWWLEMIQIIEKSKRIRTGQDHI